MIRSLSVVWKYLVAISITSVGPYNAKLYPALHAKRKAMLAFLSAAIPSGSLLKSSLKPHRLMIRVGIMFVDQTAMQGLAWD